MFTFKLPDLGEGIHEAEILKWHVDVGDAVREDDPLVDVETDKATVTIPSPRKGKIASLEGRVGEVVHVGQVIVVIDEEAGGMEGKPAAPAAAARPAPVPAAAAAPAGPVPAAPATRKLARELGVDLARVAPTGPGGRVTPEDVRAFAAAPKTKEETRVAPTEAPSPGPAASGGPVPLFEPEPLPDFERWGPVDRQPLRSIRRKIARKMVASSTIIPHVGHLDEADVTLLDRLKDEMSGKVRERIGGNLTLLAFVVKAVAAGLKEAPALNASLDVEREEILYKKYYNIGIAAATDRGLIVPVVRDADRKSVLELAAEIRRLGEAARAGTLEVEQLQGGTFTVTNIGAIGGFPIAPIINYPETAILGMGRAQEKPVVAGGEIVVRTMLPLALAFDHRVADGADAARFVTALVRRLSDPNLLLLEV